MELVGFINSDSFFSFIRKFVNFLFVYGKALDVWYNRQAGLTVIYFMVYICMFTRRICLRSGDDHFVYILINDFSQKNNISGIFIQKLPDIYVTHYLKTCVELRFVRPYRGRHEVI